MQTVSYTKYVSQLDFLTFENEFVVLQAKNGSMSVRSHYRVLFIAIRISSLELDFFANIDFWKISEKKKSPVVPGYGKV